MGRRDIWNSEVDALASTANYLAKMGWRRGETWGYEIRLPSGFNFAAARQLERAPLSQWQAMGIQRVSGKAFPRPSDVARLYMPAGANGPAFLLLPNFSRILKYNNAASYALAIAYLGERIGGRGGIQASWPRDERSLTRDERIRFQEELTALGFDTGGHDGVLGRRTRTALRAWQKASGHAADGFPTAALLALLDEAVAKKNVAVAR